jgi:uncharacterized protein (UPF0212 family)
MPEMADILRASASEYMAEYSQRMLPSHKRAIKDIIFCRTPQLGGTTYFCEPCDQYRYSYHSCKNRNCPKCGNDNATKWLAAQKALLLPVQYFMVTSTLPEELRQVARSNQKLVYGILLRTTAEAIQKLAQDPNWVGGKLGLLGVPQTWKRDMGYHVHAHFIVPGGGISRDGQRWLPAQRDYLMPERAVAKVFKAKFRDALKKTALFKQVPEKVWKRDWVVNIKPVGKGNSALKYLAPYIFRVAISNKRIIGFENQKVTFIYKDSKDNCHKKRLDAEKFISRFLQHVLPKHFVKVRYYGFLHPRKRELLGNIKELFGLFQSKEAKNLNSRCEVRVIKCPKCGGEMVFIKAIEPQRWRAPPWLIT